jgi:hypothetical protein
VYGQSVGSGPSCYLASSKPVAGVQSRCLCPCLQGLRHCGVIVLWFVDKRKCNIDVNIVTNNHTISPVGLILHSPIMSGIRVLTASRLLSCWDIYPNIERIKSVQCPVFIIHGMVRVRVVCCFMLFCVFHGVRVLSASHVVISSPKSPTMSSCTT